MNTRLATVLAAQAALAALTLALVTSAYAGGLIYGRWDRPQDAGFCPYTPGYGWDGALSMPVAGDVSHWYGGGHRGLDLDAAHGTPVTAAADGVVVWRGESEAVLSSANTVILAHGGWLTLYAHLSEIDVDCGEYVTRGDVIGAVGREGTSWDHLHIAAYQDGHDVDPAPLLGLVAPVTVESAPMVAGGGVKRGQR